MTVDRSRFAQSMTVTRHFKNELDAAGRPTAFNSKPFEPNQIVMESDEFVFVSRVPLTAGSAIPRMIEVEPGWSLVDQFASRASVPVPLRGQAVVPRGFATPVESNEGLDKALQVACDMGRWDIAFMMVVKVWDLGVVTPSSVVWETFPHHSVMSVVTEAAGGGRLTVFSPAGLSRTVIERWWAWQGGYHNKRASLWVDWTEYKAVMEGLRNPFNLAGQPGHPETIKASKRPVALVPGALAPSDLTGKAWFWGDGVAYLANSRGEVLPYWFVSGKDGAQGEVAELAWGEDVRNRLGRQMNLPILIARRSSAD